MHHLARRGFLTSVAASAAALLTPEHASATLVRGLSLNELVGQSHHILILTPLDAYSHYEEVGGRRSIVTDTRVRVDEAVAKTAPIDTELLVRTLGGRVGSVGEIVQGQAELTAGGRCVAFLKRGRVEHQHWFIGMAQGHYPLSGSLPSELQLEASHELPSIRDWQTSAVRRLVGRKLGEARTMIRAAVTR